VAVLRKGELQQVAEPQELYDRPVNLFVGGFIGSPAMNLVEATLERSDGRLVAVAGTQRIGIDEATLAVRPALREHEGQMVILGIRPEDLEDAELVSDIPDDRRLHGRVELREALGSEIMVHFTIDARPARTAGVIELAEDVHGKEGAAQVPSAEATETRMIGRFGARSRVQEGQMMDAAVDARALHFFDPATGLGIYDSSTTKGTT
jgi:multiple sugar transport system ATP-binding protein